MTTKSRSLRQGDAVAHLVRAAQGRRPSDNPQPWTFGWSVEDYRRSDTAAIAIKGGAVGLTPEAVMEFESGVRSVLSRGLADRWDESELWAEAAAAVARLPTRTESAQARGVEAWLSDVLSPADTVVAFAISNVEPPAVPVSMGNLVVGQVGDEWLKAVHKVARLRPTIRRTSDVWWLAAEAHDGPPVTAFAGWLPARGVRAVSLAEQLFDDFIAAALLLEPHPGALDLWSMRGDAYRPGVRGISIHRSAINEHEIARRELNAQIVFADSRGQRPTVRWLGERMFPFDRLLQPARRPFVEYILTGPDALGRRLRTGARWYAKSHWSATPSDAILALGIALDALLADPGGSPGRVLIERFALLEAEPAKRKDRAREAKRIYEARSAVAHGGESSRAKQPHFVRDAQEAFRRIVGCCSRSGPPQVSTLRPLTLGPSMTLSGALSMSRAEESLGARRPRSVGQPRQAEFPSACSASHYGRLVRGQPSGRAFQFPMRSRWRCSWLAGLMRRSHRRWLRAAARRRVRTDVEPGPRLPWNPSVTWPVLASGSFALLAPAGAILAAIGLGVLLPIDNYAEDVLPTLWQVQAGVLGLAVAVSVFAFQAFGALRGARRRLVSLTGFPAALMTGLL